MSDEDREGWFTDPYARHDARWFSDGQPTKLVRDGRSTSYDDPPATPPARPPERLDADFTPTDGRDLRRADDAESVTQGWDDSKATWALIDQIAIPRPGEFDQDRSQP